MELKAAQQWDHDGRVPGGMCYIGMKESWFKVPDFPKVGFWTIRVSAQGQIEEKRVN